MKKAKHTLLGIVFLFFSTATLADMPLSLEELYIDKGKFKLESNISYVNTEQESHSLINPVYVQTQGNSLIAVPTNISQDNTNSDILIGTLGLRYGLTGKTDIYGNVSYLWQSSRSFNGVNESKEKDHYLSDATIGISHTFLEDDKNPALIGFLEMSAYEKVLNKSSSAKSWVVGATTYKAIDPVVLSLTAAYRWNGKRNTELGNYKPANYILINPSVSFAANDKISFSGDIQWLNTQSERIDGEKIAPRNTATYAKLGVGFGLSDKTTLNASARWKISGNSSAELNFGLTHQF